MLVDADVEENARISEFFGLSEKDVRQYDVVSCVCIIIMCDI